MTAPIAAARASPTPTRDCARTPAVSSTPRSSTRSGLSSRRAKPASPTPSPAPLPSARHKGPHDARGPGRRSPVRQGLSARTPGAGRNLRAGRQLQRDRPGCDGTSESPDSRPSELTRGQARARAQRAHRGGTEPPASRTCPVARGCARPHPTTAARRGAPGAGALSAGSESRSEIVKLARLLEVDEDALEYLVAVPADALRDYRERVVDLLFDDDREQLSRAA